MVNSFMNNLNAWLVQHLPYWEPLEWVLFWLQVHLHLNYFHAVLVLALALGILLRSLAGLCVDVYESFCRSIPAPSRRDN